MMGIDRHSEALQTPTLVWLRKFQVKACASFFLFSFEIF